MNEELLLGSHLILKLLLKFMYGDLMQEKLGGGMDFYHGGAIVSKGESA